MSHCTPQLICMSRSEKSIQTELTYIGLKDNVLILLLISRIIPVIFIFTGFLGVFPKLSICILMKHLIICVKNYELITSGNPRIFLQQKTKRGIWNRRKKSVEVITMGNNNVLLLYFNLTMTIVNL